MPTEPSAGCPFHADRDDRKSAAVAAARMESLGLMGGVTSFNVARSILRNSGMRQAGLPGAEFGMDNPEHASVFFLDGEPHRRKRSAISQFFTPKAIETRHVRVMENTTATLLADLQAKGEDCLDHMAWLLAVDVGGEVVGLTTGLEYEKKIKLANDLEKVMEHTSLATYSGDEYRAKELVFQERSTRFHVRYVLPAIRTRRREPQDDIITHLIGEHYSDAGIFAECMTYAGAGMVTTREFIVMVAWHLFDNPELCRRFLDGDRDEQNAMLVEILRLEPVASMLYRVADNAADVAVLPEGVAPGGSVLIDLRGANLDEAAAGECPLVIDPDRAQRMAGSGTYLSFGDGVHRCPGAQLALTETRIFIDRLMRLPGIQLAAPPRIEWNDALMSYELRGAMVRCAGPETAAAI